jgi:carboxylate-amine ligase
MSQTAFTIGIEEEYQIIDPETREVTSYVQEFFEQGRHVLKDQIKPEFLQSQIEVGSRICRSIGEAREELIRLRRTVIEVAEAHDLAVCAASTHPFSKWLEQRITAAERYTKHEAAMAEVARRMLIFGMHVHIGFDDRELLIDVMDQARYFLPHLLALSTSSPFWHGRVTGLKSYRTVVFESLPRTGAPPSFSSWADFESYIQLLVKTGSIEEPTTIWWDMRPHPKYGTLELRVFDICTRVDDAICLAALALSIVVKLIRLRRGNRSWRRYRQELVAENKWRASRYGIEGNLIDFGREAEVPVADLAREMLELVDDVVDDLGVRREVEHVGKILDEGTSADRQLKVFRETGELTAVVDHLIRETREGIC